MSRSARRLGWVASVLVVVAATAARGDEPRKMTVENDLVYARPGGTELKLDVARPAEGEGPFPVVFVIHGGAWRGGNKSDTRPALHALAQQGYVAVSPQYRFCPKDTFPAQIHDVKAAVRWVKAHAKDYKADPGRVGVVGFSAGAHLALLLGLTGPSDGLEGDVSGGEPDTKVHAVVSFAGPTDLAAADLPDVSKPLVKDFLGGTPGEKPEAAKKASPLTYVSKGDAPMLCFQGTKDTLVPHTQATKLADAMTAAGVPGRVDLIVGAGHGLDPDDLKRAFAETGEFLNRMLKPPGR